MQTNQSREYRRYRDDHGLLQVIPQQQLNEWPNLRSKFRIYRQDNIVSQRPTGSFPVVFEGRAFKPITGYWEMGQKGMEKLIKAGRIEIRGKMLGYVRYYDDYPVARRSNYLGIQSF